MGAEIIDIGTPLDIESAAQQKPTHISPSRRIELNDAAAVYVDVALAQLLKLILSRCSSWSMTSIYRGALRVAMLNNDLRSVRSSGFALVEKCLAHPLQSSSN
jgi:hypothetical protein